MTTGGQRTVDAETPDPAAATPPHEAPALGALFRQLAEDGRALIQQEVALAKSEVTFGARSLVTNGAFIAIGALLLVVGLLVLTAFLVVGIGRLLGDQYWLSSLIVGGTFALLGGAALLRGKSGLARSTLKPGQTLRTLRENKEWAKAEIAERKHDLTS